MVLSGRYKSGMGHGARSMEYGVWSMEHGAWSMLAKYYKEEIIIQKKQKLGHKKVSISAD